MDSLIGHINLFTTRNSTVNILDINSGLKTKVTIGQRRSDLITFWFWRGIYNLPIDYKIQQLDKIFYVKDLITESPGQICSKFNTLKDFFIIQKHHNILVGHPDTNCFIDNDLIVHKDDNM